MYFQKYGLSMTSLKNSLESNVSEAPSTVNLLLGAKHLWNLHESTFIIFFDYSEAQSLWNLHRILNIYKQMWSW